MSVIPRPWFEFPFLRRVIPIDASAEMKNRRLILQSLELYEGVFVAVIDLEVMALGEPGTFTVINARDEFGNRYIGQLQAGHGGGSSTGIFRERIVIGFSSPLHPDATAITFECTEVRTGPGSLIGFVEGVGHVYPQQNVIGNPWEVMIPIAAMTDDRMSVDPHEEPMLPDHDFASLIRVVPVGQQQVIRDVGLTVLSLELYRDSLIANVRVDRPGLGTPSLAGVDGRRRTTSATPISVTTWAVAGCQLETGRRLDWFTSSGLRSTRVSVVCG